MPRVRVSISGSDNLSERLKTVFTVDGKALETMNKGYFHFPGIKVSNFDITIAESTRLHIELHQDDAGWIDTRAGSTVAYEGFVMPLTQRVPLPIEAWLIMCKKGWKCKKDDTWVCGCGHPKEVGKLGSWANDDKDIIANLHPRIKVRIEELQEKDEKKAEALIEESDDLAQESGMDDAVRVNNQAIAARFLQDDFVAFIHRKQTHLSVKYSSEKKSLAIGSPAFTGQAVGIFKTKEQGGASCVHILVKKAVNGNWGCICHRSDRPNTACYYNNIDDSKVMRSGTFLEIDEIANVSTLLFHCFTARNPDRNSDCMSHGSLTPRSSTDGMSHGALTPNRGVLVPEHSPASSPNRSPGKKRSAKATLTDRSLTFTFPFEEDKVNELYNEALKRSCDLNLGGKDGKKE